MTVSKKLFVRIIVVCFHALGLIAQAHISQAMENSPINDQRLFSLEVGKRTLTFYNKVNSEKNWRYSTCTSMDLKDYKEYLFTGSKFWKISEPSSSGGLNFYKIEDVSGSLAFDDILNCKAIIDCERTLRCFLTKVFRDIIGLQNFDRFIKSEEVKYPISIFPIFRFESQDNVCFRQSKTIGHFGYTQHASLYVTLSEKYNSSKLNWGYHSIIVGHDENGQALHVSFDAYFIKPRTNQEIKTLLINELYELMELIAKNNPSLFLDLNENYLDLNENYLDLNESYKDLQSNEEIKTSFSLRNRIDVDYEDVNSVLFSNYVDLVKIKEYFPEFSFKIDGDL